MFSAERLRTAFSAALDGAEPGLATADRLCRACVDLLDVDGAAISLTHAGTTQGTFGSSNELSRRLDEFQFTFGEGPCIDSVAQGAPVLVADLQDPAETRWPAFAGAVAGTGIRAVFALPVSINTLHVGALDLFRITPGTLGGPALTGALLGAQLAALPLLDLMTAQVDWAGITEGDLWAQLASLDRVEIHQATGMVMIQAGVGPTEALVRLRAHAYAHDLTASQAAWAIIGRRLRLEPDDPCPNPHQNRRAGP